MVLEHVFDEDSLPVKRQGGLMLLGMDVIFRAPDGEAYASKIIKVHDSETVDLIFWQCATTQFMADRKRGNDPGQWQYPTCVQLDKHGRPDYREVDSGS